MPEGRVYRKLVAILAADVVGYSRLMGMDEAGTLARLMAHRKEFIDPTIAEHQGRIVKLMGDGALVEFASVVSALACAMDLQRGMQKRNQDESVERRIEFRMGINLGDVIVEGKDIYGDGVNVAARLEGLAEPGGICISEAVHTAIGNKLSVGYDDIGEQRVKNIEKPVRVYRVISTEDSNANGIPEYVIEGHEAQEIHFCTSSDGVNIAYALVGQGPPLVKAANWLNHLEFDWQSPIWRHVFAELSRGHQLVRYDGRGNGLSDWEVDDISFDSFVRDLEAVADASALERFALLGISQGCSVSIAYAVRHPERVSQLVLYGGYALGWARRGSKDKERGKAVVELIRQGWGQDNPAFRQLFTSQMMPGATAEQMQWFNELQRITTSPEIAAQLRLAMGEIDVMSLLPQVSTPTLVIHAREDAVAPFEGGRQIASMIPGARFVPLESANHLLLESEPAWPRFLAEVRSFLH